VDISREHSIEIPGLASDASEAKAKLHVGSLLGKMFGQHETCECDGFLIRKIETEKYNEVRRRTVVLKNYIIERVLVQDTFDFTNGAQRAQQG
jgi:hypothetical protein